MDFWRIVSPGLQEQALVTGHHNHLVCLAAVALAVLAASVTLPVSERFASTRGVLRYLWLMAGTISMGSGIWAMHFTSMLAYDLPFPVRYDIATTMLSMVPALLAGYSSILLFAPARACQRRMHLAALLLATGIAAMHYIGMEAITAPADMYYSPIPFFLSVVAAYLLSWVGLCCRITLPSHTGLSTTVTTLVGSAILGLAVSAMHFIAMASTYFIPSGVQTVSGPYIQPSGLVVAILAVTFVLLSLLSIGILVDRHLARMALSLQSSEVRFQRLAETTQAAIFTFVDGRITYANPALSQITDYSIESLSKMTLEELFGEAFMQYVSNIAWDKMEVGEPLYEQFQITTAAGEKRWLYFSMTMAEFDQQPAVLASACDISEQKLAEFKMRHLAYSDQLTGLANRALFMDRLEHHLKLMGRSANDSLSIVLLLDLDNFKLINDTYGHVLGDQLLSGVAQRMQSLARKSDTLARLGGDEFVMLFENVENMSVVGRIAERMIDTLSERYVLNGKNVEVKVSMGVVVLDPSNHKTQDHVLHDADVALYRAKNQGRACWVLFDQQMDEMIKRGRLLQGELKTAIADGKLQLYYQPIVCAGNHRLCGFESLARWQRDNGEWVSPVEFIALAEEAGLVADVGLWAIETACRQIGEWNRSHGGADYYISVNIASDSFGDERFTRCISDCFARYGVCRGQLKLELTERILLTDTERMLDKLNTLIDLGCEIMIDDFGTGYSSLSYLHLLPVGAMKIDRSFVLNLEKSDSSLSVVKTIIALARSLDMGIVAEGVEKESQAEQLAALGATQLQGYLFGRPVSADLAEGFFVSLEVEEGVVNNLNA
ncbi:MAG: EAL domain-containing protein [Gammaproteobacteria bacterium]|nr:MAG: EAL domain-containing protein [Gammaproteobacteria bacterium]